jgi:hypothetical protein
VIRARVVHHSLKPAKLVKRGQQPHAPGVNRRCQTPGCFMRPLAVLLLAGVFRQRQPLAPEAEPLPQGPDTAAKGAARVMAVEYCAFFVNRDCSAPVAVGAVKPPWPRRPRADLGEQFRDVCLDGGTQNGTSSSLISTS